MDDRDVLLTLIAEALGEGPEGMRRVGETILNRAAIRGLTPAEVVRQPHQYTGYSAPGPAAVAAQRNPAAISTAEAAWNLARQPGDPTDGADHYHADYVDPDWASAMPKTGQHGQHLFYRSRQVPQEALAALLTPETRDVPPPRARPASPSDNIAAMFQDSFNTPQDPATGAGLDQLIRSRAANAQPAITNNDLLFSSGITDTARNTQAMQRPDLAAALEQYVRPQPAQNFGVSPATQQSVAAAFAPPRMSTAQQRTDNGQDRPAPRQAQVRLPELPPSNIGKPPTTRVVQSVPVPAPQPGASKKSAALVAKATIGPTEAAPVYGPSMATVKDESRLAPGQWGVDAIRQPYGPYMVANAPAKRDPINVMPPPPRPRPEPKEDAIAQMYGPYAVTNLPKQPQMANVPYPKRRPDRPGPAAITQPRRAPQTAITQPQRSLAPPVIQPRQQVAARPALQIAVQGANSYSGGGGGRTVTGSATGQRYAAGQGYEAGGHSYVANNDGSFTNTKSGVTHGGSGKRTYDFDSNSWN